MIVGCVGWGLTTFQLPFTSVLCRLDIRQIESHDLGFKRRQLIFLLLVDLRLVEQIGLDAYLSFDGRLDVKASFGLDGFLFDLSDFLQLLLFLLLGLLLHAPLLEFLLLLQDECFRVEFVLLNIIIIHFHLVIFLPKLVLDSWLHTVVKIEQRAEIIVSRASHSAQAAHVTAIVHPDIPDIVVAAIIVQRKVIKATIVESRKVSKHATTGRRHLVHDLWSGVDHDGGRLGSGNLVTTQIHAIATLHVVVNGWDLSCLLQLNCRLISLRFKLLLPLLLLFKLLLAEGLFSLPLLTLFRLSKGDNAALLGEHGGFDALPVGLLDEIHVNDARFDYKRCFTRRFYRLRLLRDDASAIFCTERDIFVHALVLLLQEALLVVPSVICL